MISPCPFILGLVFTSLFIFFCSIFFPYVLVFFSMNYRIGIFHIFALAEQERYW